MKRKFIVLDDDESGEEGCNSFLGKDLSKDLSRSPPRRLASLSLSDSSRTLSPEPRRLSNNHSSAVSSQLGDTAINSNSRSLREAHNDALAASASPRARAPNPSILHSGTRPKGVERKKMTKACEIIDLDEEVTEIRPLNLDEGEVIDVEELELELANEIFEIRDYDRTHPAFVESWARNPPVKAPFKKVDIARSQRGEYLLPGYSVELRDGRFLEIATIVENIETKVVNLRGWELKRTKYFGGELKFKYNEVCYIFEVDLDDSRPMREQSVIEIGLNRVKKIRNLVRTNYHFPAYRFNIDELPEGTQQKIQRYVESKEVLVARWQYITTFRTAKDRNQQAKYSANYQSRKFVRLDEKECDDNRYLPLYALRYQWRGDALSTNLGQSSTTTRSEGARDARTHAVQACPNSCTDIICIDNSDDEANIQGQRAQNSTTTPVLIHVTSSDFMNVDPWTFMGNIRRRFDARANLGVNDIRGTGRAEEPSRCPALKASTQQGDMRNGNQTKTCRNTTATDGHQYSYADAFCGAGGATRGAVMAGLRVVWGLDFNANAAQTWRHNFPQGQMFEKWADKVCSMPDPERKLIVDVLHLSPPCQVWSPAHTIAGKDDDMNFASLYAVQELIAKAKPRMVTLEQTFGIIHNRFRRPFNNLIRMFTDHNFSVSWQILELERLGLPQRRKRLIIVAAAPGETLPPIPPYTHSRDGSNGMKPFQSARRALSSIPRNAANHDVPVHAQGNYMPWDDSTIIPNCITTGGANGRGHPSGRRGLTCREVASLQTFPHGHVFRGQGIRKQIGNAVPPLIAKLVFSEVKRHLEHVDAEEKRLFETSGADNTR